MTQARAQAALGATPPAVLVLTGVVSVQVGAGLAARLFSQVPPAAVTGLRLWTAALLLAVLGARGLRREITGLIRRRAWADAAVVVAFGLTLAVMNYSIYQAFARIPLGDRGDGGIPRAARGGGGRVPAPPRPGLGGAGRRRGRAAQPGRRQARRPGGRGMHAGPAGPRWPG